MHCTEHHQWRDERRKWRDVAERPLAQRWWEDTRGGAQVEGAMAVLFLAMMFAAFLWYQHVTYVELATVREAGRELWEPALNGCEEGSPAEAQEWVGGYRGVQAELAPAAASRLETIRESDVDARAFGHADRPAAFGGGAVEIERVSGTACNPLIPEGRIPWEPRVRQVFCERYPTELLWPDGCAAD